MQSSQSPKHGKLAGPCWSRPKLNQVHGCKPCTDIHSAQSMNLSAFCDLLLYLSNTSICDQIPAGLIMMSSHHPLHTKN